MVEVFKTNVNRVEHARLIANEIEAITANYRVNFDLYDCDRIMRVKSTEGDIDAVRIILLLKTLGFDAQVLQEEIASHPDLSKKNFEPGRNEIIGTSLEDYLR